MDERENQVPAALNENIELTPQQGQSLIALARQTLAHRFKRNLSDQERLDLETQLQDPIFQVHCGAFVTLKIEGHLRGCIGSLVGRETLVDGVRSNTINAAFHDPRFRPLSNGELNQVTIEVSVLTMPRPLQYNGAEDLLHKLQPGVDGVTIRKELASATFLPQVWKQLPDKEDFLAQLCRKAGLDADAWHSGDLDVETYQVQYFLESQCEGVHGFRVD